MKRPVLPLLEEAFEVNDPQDLPHGITFEVPYAERDVLAIPEGFFISQRYSDYFYFMEILEISIEEDLCLPYEISDFSAFLFFMLEGHGRFTTLAGQGLSEAHKGTCYLTVNAAGRYFLHLEKGIHIMAYVRPQLDWIIGHEKEWPLLTDFILGEQGSGQQVAFMHKTAMGRAVSKRLIEMWRLSAEHTEDIELKLAHQVKALFHAYYDSLLQVDQVHLICTEEKIHAVNRYLEQHFQQADIGDVRRLCDRFLLTERTLRRAFVKVNGKTVSDYLKDLRISHAQEILLDTTSSIERIARLCGFRSANYFCRVFRERCGCSPAVFRKRTVV